MAVSGLGALVIIKIFFERESDYLRGGKFRVVYSMGYVRETIFQLQFRQL